MIFFLILLVFNFIVNIFTKKKGKIDGIVYGGNSRKIRNYLQISNKLFVSHNSKSENKIGYFKTELIKPSHLSQPVLI